MVDGVAKEPDTAISHMIPNIATNNNQRSSRVISPPIAREKKFANPKKLKTSLFEYGSRFVTRNSLDDEAVQVVQPVTSRQMKDPTAKGSDLQEEDSKNKSEVQMSNSQ
jgi:hypothetical protein